MTVDPREPETFEDVQPDEPDQETPEADAAEQHADLRPESDEPLTDLDRSGASEADAADQARVVPQDEDDYR
ncbi:MULTISPECIES: hypothetical protein [unclassified Streptomyces]|uniref:hypothetical protein n=1 Tax=unclassified Streptomyces TaxID=2593676 RepID=UPI00104E9B81|nr:hypothetical protein [Streptomyces sp. NBC_01423]WSX93159.1 hypothetical protein OH827_22650 [Streptomyces sp. NBC_00891]WSY07636.1 hypothetical protein OG464_22650 [Streptomyces sp. NBC_00890]WSZ09262.1 hypothetical protein OG704_22655 [Streptomyces sp. NBC_00869]WSZ23239.1 hypothetical protein OG498_10915 [Streptomyces sp. NBC_00870]